MDLHEIQYMTVEDVASALQVSTKHVIRMINDGELQAIRVRTLYRIPIEAFESLKTQIVTGE